MRRRGEILQDSLKSLKSCAQVPSTAHPAEILLKARQYNHTDAFHYILSIINKSHKTIATLSTRLFPLAHLKHSKKAQITLWGECSPHISATTSTSDTIPSVQRPVGGSSLASIKVTGPYYHSLALHTIPPIEISTKFPCWGKF